MLRIAASRLFVPALTELPTVGEFKPVTGQKLPGYETTWRVAVGL
ncbi:hypothetical protein HX92_2481 [Mycobacterium tuberculosis]|nr:hypothetical protein BTB1458_4233 [Mycobacterium tuberculosis]BAQ08052.1 hypothetical protein KURONO_4284 [Mycobacterium tuberculosis str. Kurono]KDA16325.1 hypothetical protein CO60_0202 [Mycobacterium tuberculosis]KQL79641.1 hypothetical protein HX92_2481 [Mycobacterium tuberculosis]KRT46344.1 hypothetical protein EI32_1463 [Mycobacterium tuberculosis]